MAICYKSCMFDCRKGMSKKHNVCQMVLAKLIKKKFESWLRMGTLSQLRLGLKTNNVHPSSNYRGKLMCIALFWYPTRIPKWAHNSTTYYMKILHSQDFIRKTWYMQRESINQDHIHVTRPCHLQIKAGPLGTVKKSRLSPRSHAHRDDQS